MYFTIRAFLYSIIGVVFILLFSAFFTPIGSIIIFNVIFILVIILDFFSCLPKDKILVKRVIDDKLSLGAKNCVEFYITNNFKFRARAKFKDEVPEDFKIEKGLMETKIDSFAKSKISYKVIPTRRGIYKFGKLYVRTRGVLGIVGRQYSLDVEKVVKVYPNIKDISTYRLLSRKGRLLEVGLKPSKIYGIGTDFEYLREYVPGDEFRKINWKATARRSKIITSQYQTERSQNVFIVIEAGRMMTSIIDGISKLDYAINSALLLSYVAMDKGDNVGLMVFSNEIKVYLPPKRGKRQLSLIIEALYSLKAEMLEPDYGKAMRYLSQKNKKRSLVVFFTDLIDIDVSKAIVVYSRSLYPLHLPLCVTMADPSVYEEAKRFPEDMLGLYRKATAEDLIYQREQVKLVLNHGGVLVLDVEPKFITPSLITKYLSIKTKNKL